MKPIVCLLLAGLLAGAVPARAWAEGPGRYDVAGANPGGRGAYKGVAQLSQTGRETWHMTWKIGNESFDGFGVGDAKSFAVTFSSGRAQGIALYTAQPDGTYKGVWAGSTDPDAGTETLTPAH